MSEKMLATKALNELKILNSRIERGINNALFVACAKTCEKNVTPGVSKEEFKKDAQSAYNSIVDLIKRKTAIKTALDISNVSTEITVGNETMKVIEALERKNHIQCEKDLLNKMMKQLYSADSTMARNNENMEAKIEDLVKNAYGKESKTSIKADDYDSIAVPYRKSNEYSLVDPLDLKKKIEELHTSIENFESNVDAALQISNCQTEIEIL